MIHKGFKIENRPAYLWRSYCWGAHSGHNHVACWYVESLDGRPVVGGFDPGNNTRSGHPNIPRRKDAKAWVDGFRAYHDEPGNRQEIHGGKFVHAPTYGKHHKDAEQAAHFDAGYWAAQHSTTNKAKP